jgi:hypothetical protein
LYLSRLALRTTGVSQWVKECAFFWIGRCGKVAVRRYGWSAHGTYHHEFHIVWIPKYRKKILKRPLKEFVAERIHEIEEYHPDVEIE